MRKIIISSLDTYIDYSKKITAFDFFLSDRKKFLALANNRYFKINPVVLYFLEQFSEQDIARLKQNEKERDKVIDLYKKLIYAKEEEFSEVKQLLAQERNMINISHLMKPIFADSCITLLDLIRFHRVDLNMAVREGKLDLSQNMYQLYLDSIKETKRRSVWWYVNKLHEIEEHNKEIDRWEKIIMQIKKENRTVLIHDPIQPIDSLMNTSLMALYFDKYYIFQMVTTAERILISKKVLDFFHYGMPPHQIYPPLTKEEILIHWRSFQENHKYINCAEPLLRKTRAGKMKWVKVNERKLFSGKEYRFVTEENDCHYIFNVYALKRGNNKWHCSYELSENGVSDSEFPALYPKLFKLVWNTEENEIIEKSVDAKTTEKSVTMKAEKKKKREIKRIFRNTLLIRTHIFRCRYDNHEVEDVFGELPILLPDGTRQMETVEAAYCPSCGCFYIHEYEYQRIVSKGILLCRVIKNEAYRTGSYTDFSSLKEESLLMQNGYSVRSDNPLTEAQRRLILKEIIETGILSKAAVISYLQLFIRQRENISSCISAVEKWNRDLEYVKQLTISIN